MLGVLAGGVLGFLLTGLLVQHVPPGPWPRYEASIPWHGGPPAPADWPRAPRPGESALRVESDGGNLLRVRAVRDEDVRELAAGLQRRRLSGLGEGAARRAAVRAQWRAGRLPEPEPWLARATRAAALVRGRLLLLGLLDAGAETAAPPSSPAVDGARERVAAAGAEVARLALAGKPDSLATALTGSAAAEGAWLREVAAHPAITSLAALESAWRWHERSIAPGLDSVERRLEARLTPAQAELVAPLAFDRALRLERLAPDPAAAYFVGGRWAAAAEPVPIAATWAMLFGSGTLAGALAGLALAAPRRRRRAGRGAAAARPARGPLAREPRQAVRAELSWLHVVSGPDGVRVAHAVDRLAGVFLGRGERVLVVDAGRELLLHERFGGDPRWGLGEWLAGEVPLLGAVQSAGRPRFYLLGRGGSGVGGRWEAVSGLLEEARQHFERVIVALEARVPSAAALPLGGRVLEAWWAEPGAELPPRAVALSERLGISFMNLDLSWLAQVEREDAAPAPAGAPEFRSAPVPPAVEPASPDGTVPEAPRAFDAGSPEDAMPEAVVPETVVPEAVVPETVVPEAVVPEAVVPEEALPEAALPADAPEALVAVPVGEPAGAPDDAAGTGVLAAGPVADTTGQLAEPSVEDAVATDGAADTGDEIPATAVTAAAGEPPVLGCDREVRDRLRFLVWMKRVRAERRAAPVEVGTDA